MLFVAYVPCLNLYSYLQLVKIEQSFIDFEDIVFPILYEKGNNHVELDAFRKGIACLFEQFQRLVHTELQGNGEGDKGWLLRLVTVFFCIFGKQFAVNISFPGYLRGCQALIAEEFVMYLIFFTKGFKVTASASIREILAQKFQ